MYKQDIEILMVLMNIIMRKRKYYELEEEITMFLKRTRRKGKITSTK